MTDWRYLFFVPRALAKAGDIHTNSLVCLYVRPSQNL